jgi:hypothetical protein
MIDCTPEGFCSSFCLTAAGVTGPKPAPCWGATVNSSVPRDQLVCDTANGGETCRVCADDRLPHLLHTISRNIGGRRVQVAQHRRYMIAIALRVRSRSTRSTRFSDPSERLRRSPSEQLAWDWYRRMESLLCPTQSRVSRRGIHARKALRALSSCVAGLVPSFASGRRGPVMRRTVAALTLSIAHERSGRAIIVFRRSVRAAPKRYQLCRVNDRSVAALTRARRASRRSRR